MESILVAGGAGFIGSNFVRLAARAHGRAGRGPRSPHLCRQPREPRRRPSAPALCVRPGRHRGSRGGGGPPREAPPGRRREPGRGDPRRPLDRRPARIRRDEPGRHVRAPGRGAPAPRDARARAPGPLPVPARLHRRGVRLPRAHGTLRRGEPVRAQLAVRRVEGRRRPPRARVYETYRLPTLRHELLEQLRALPVSGEADPPHDAQRDRGPTACRSTATAATCGTGSTSRTIVRRCSSCCGRALPAVGTTWGRATSGRTSKSWTGSARRSRRSARRPATRRWPRGASSATRDLRTFVADRPGHDRRYAVDATRITTELGWRPAHRFEDGLRSTVGWYLEHRAWGEIVLAGKYGRERLGLGEAAPSPR